MTEAWTEAYFGAPTPRRPGPGPAAGAVQPVRLVAVGLHPGGHQPARLRLPRLGAWSGSTRPRRPSAGRTLARTAASDVADPVAEPPVPRRDRGRRRRRHRRVGGLPPDQAGQDRRAAARAGPPLRRYDVARGRAGRSAARLGERHPAGAVLRRALRLARGRDRAVDRLPQRRRRDRGAHRGPDGPAAAHRGQRRGVRHGLRAGLARARPGALAGDAGRRPARRAVAARRRQGQPDRPDPVAGQGRPAWAAPGCAERVRVTGFATRRPAGHRASRPTRATVECDVVVNCARPVGARRSATMVGVTVPLHSCEHFYVVTEAVEGTHPDLPIMRDPDGWTYFKEEVGGLVVGGFEPEAKPWRAPDDLPHPFEFQLLEEDWEHFSVLMDEARAPDPGARRDRHPEVLQRAGVVHAGQPVPAGPGARAGQLLRRRRLQLGRHRLRRRRRTGAGGVGRGRRAGRRPDRGRRPPVRAVGRRPGVPARPGGRDPRPALRPAVAQPRAGDGPRRTALAAARPAGRARCGLRHQERLGAAALLRRAAELDYTWGKPSWLAASAAEQRACRTGVAVFDQTSFSKYAVAGPGALEALQWVCAADVDVPVGHVVYTPWLNERGTYEADLTVTRDGPDSFWVVSSSATTVRDLDWLRRHGRGRGVRRDRRLRRARRDGTGRAGAPRAGTTSRSAPRGP